ncbi:MAG: metal-dependent hydrolase [Planctomycetota bacterium]
MEALQPFVALTDKAWFVFRRGPIPWRRAALALVLATATHGALDALTDGGLGVAFLAPFSPERFFLPWTPIPVAPLSVRGFFTGHGLAIFAWEGLTLWLPFALLLILVRAARARSVRKPRDVRRSP